MKETENKQIRQIWFALLLTFIFDPYLSLPLAKIGAVNAGYIATAFLVLVYLIGSQEKINRIKLNLLKVQIYFFEGYKARLILITFVVLAIFAEIIINFSPLLFKSFIHALFVIAALVFAGLRLHKDRKDHEKKMSNDPFYFKKHLSTQNLIIAILPPLLARAAGIFSFVQFKAEDTFYLGLLQYFLSIVLFFQTLPSENGK